ncbi:MAG: succinyl-diaminopimelate desuccinylase, partial [Actinomycetota bacterium]|nr:succinyl-diaminopimelate desuccinylase [Actinomycetota bacterium]
MVPRIDLSADVVDVAASLIDIPSESHHEREIADALEVALSGLPHLRLRRSGNALVAEVGEPRVIIAGHLDTVPAAENLPHRIEGDRLFGLGSVDMKGGVAIAAKLAHDVTEPHTGVRFIFYDCEEVAAVHNGLARLAAEEENILRADLAIVMEPSNGMVEGGCQGTIRVEVRVEGERAHSARSWKGTNAIHGAADVLARLAAYQPREPMVDGLRYREGLNAVGIRGGIAGNVIPDACIVTVNYRFAPDRSVPEAIYHVREVLSGYDVTVVDEAPGARPGLDQLVVQQFVEAVGVPVEPKYGWTDVARFSSAGTPALNYGPGDPTV